MTRLHLIFLLLAGCASPDPRARPKTYRWAESDQNSKAPGAAFAGSAMLLRTPMPDRRDFREWEFYFKHCSRVDVVDRPYVSKTQYDCNGPY